MATRDEGLRLTGLASGRVPALDGGAASSAVVGGMARNQPFPPVEYER